MSDLFDNKNISPMLLYETQPFSDEDYIYELKLDGIRCIAYLGEQKVALGISKEERRIVEVFAKNNRVSKPWLFSSTIISISILIVRLQRALTMVRALAFIKVFARSERSCLSAGFSYKTKNLNRFPSQGGVRFRFNVVTPTVIIRTPYFPSTADLDL